MATVSLRGCRSLLAILTAFLVSFPMLQELARPILLTAIIAAVCVLGVIAVEPGRSRVRRAVLLAALQVAFTVLSVSLTANSTPYFYVVGAALATTAASIGYCIYCVLLYVLQANFITTDQVYAGGCVYLLLGFAFGCIYYLIAILDPNGFLVNPALQERARTPDLMYFSFVTLATLGYGDITPVAKLPRALAQVEALIGTLYMAVFMARLVSMIGSGRSSLAEPQVSAGASNTHQ